MSRAVGRHIFWGRSHCNTNETRSNLSNEDFVILDAFSSRLLPDFIFDSVGIRRRRAKFIGLFGPVQVLTRIHPSLAESAAFSF